MPKAKEKKLPKNEHFIHIKTVLNCKDGVSHQTETKLTGESSQHARFHIMSALFQDSIQRYGIQKTKGMLEHAFQDALEIVL